MEYLIQYAMFLAKVATIVVAIILVIGALGSSSSRHKGGGRRGSMKVTRLNDHYAEMLDELKFAVLEKEELKLSHKQQKKDAKAAEKEKKKSLKDSRKKHSEATPVDTSSDSTDITAGEGSQTSRKKRVYVLNFDGDIAAQAVDSLREEITTVLSLAEESDEVLLRLESPGGMVHAYGLAASQLSRIRNNKIPLTICVDKVAASGGYMMACLADKLVAAPFAIIGSIGVLVQLPNFHRILKKHDVDYEIITAGEYKRTLSTFGEITQKGKEKVQEDVQDIHDIFKTWVKDHRPSVDIEKIATGETWVGMKAKERYMVDEVKTSDECIVAACEEADVFEVEYELRKSIQDKLGSVFQGTADTLLSRWFNKANNDTFYQ